MPKKKKAPEVVNAVTVKLMDDGSWKFDSDPAIPNWALPTFIQFALNALTAKKEA